MPEIVVPLLIILFIISLFILLFIHSEFEDMNRQLKEEKLKTLMYKKRYLNDIKEMLEEEDNEK